MPQHPIDVRAVDGGVAACAPTRTATQERRVRNFANKNIAAHGVHLRMAFKTKIIVALDEHFIRNRAVRLMADGATVAQRLVFVNDHARLFAMTLCAGFVQAREAGCRPGLERCLMRCLENICPVWVVALDAIHAVFQYRMTMRQSELGVHINMTGETGFRFPARIDNKFAPPAPGLHVQAAWSVARFTAGSLGSRRSSQMKTRMRAGWKVASDVRVTIDAGQVANKSRSLNHRRRHDRALNMGTGSQNNADQHYPSQDNDRQSATKVHATISMFFTGCPAGKPCLEAGIA